MHMFGCAHGCVHTQAEAGATLRCRPQSLATVLPERVCCFLSELTDLMRNTSLSLHLYRLSTGVTSVQHTLSLYTCPHARMADTLPTKPSLDPLLAFLRWQMNSKAGAR